MPLINGYSYSPEAAIAADYCPECGVSFVERDPHAHRLSHWMAEPPRGESGDEGRKRRKLFDDYLAAHPKSTEAPPPPPLAPIATPAPAQAKEAQS